MHEIDNNQRHNEEVGWEKVCSKKEIINQKLKYKNPRDLQRKLEQSKSERDEERQKKQADFYEKTKYARNAESSREISKNENFDSSSKEEQAPTSP